MIHVIPLNDLKPHEEKEDCWCKPNVGDGVVVHQAMDKREEYENGRQMN